MRWLSDGAPLPPDADAVIIPGSKAVASDLQMVKQSGWATDILAFHRRGGFVLGLCGGYQMLGRVINDPDGVESAKGHSITGLGLLDVATVLAGDSKSTHRVQGHCLPLDCPATGYEIHVGKTTGDDCRRPVFRSSADFAGAGAGNYLDGAMAGNGRVWGTYWHGVFHHGAFRAHFLSHIRAGTYGTADHERVVDEALDAVASHMRQHLNIAKIKQIIGLPA